MLRNCMLYHVYICLPNLTICGIRKLCKSKLPIPIPLFVNYIILMNIVGHYVVFICCFYKYVVL